MGRPHLLQHLLLLVIGIRINFKNRSGELLIMRNLEYMELIKVKSS